MIYNNICAQTDLVMSDTYKNVAGFYFVVAHTDSGTRFYSDPIATFEAAEHIFNSYVDTVKYFNGGTVEMYKILSDDYNVIAYIRI